MRSTWPAALLALALLTGCGSSAPTGKTSPSPAAPTVKHLRHNPLHQIDMDGGGYMYYRCDDFGNLIYISSNSNTVPVVLPRNEHCPEDD